MSILTNISKFLGLTSILNVRSEEQGISNSPYNTERENKETTKAPVVQPGRTSEPDLNTYSLDFIKKQVLTVGPEYNEEAIPLIRKLSMINPDLSNAVHNIIRLANTGHRITFDSNVPPELVDEMRTILETKSGDWAASCFGISGLVNRILRQVCISGAVAIEPVIENNLSSIKYVAFLKPEKIVFKYDKSTLKYTPFQKVPANSNFLDKQIINGAPVIPLNENTFRFYALDGDNESPYPIPPLLSALNPLEDQFLMNSNIKFIIQQLGLMGFMEVSIAKPSQKDGESDGAYASRLELFLAEAKNRVGESIREGVVVGYEEDHTFKFQSSSKSLQGVESLVGLNEKLVAAGLKTDPSLLGKKSSGGAETGMTIIFTKLLSELKNLQELCAKVLEFIYTTELRLRGYNFKYCKVKFLPSTIQDDLKSQQAVEIKIRNLNALYWDGIIDLEQYAEEMGFEAPSQNTPRAARNISSARTETDPSSKAAKDKARTKSKQQSRVAKRGKDKPQQKKIN